MEQIKPACFITGHRPTRFLFKDDETAPLCQSIKAAIKSELIRLYDAYGIRGAWVGGAAGVDTWAAEIVLELKKQIAYQDFMLFAAIPYKGFGTSFDAAQRERLEIILKSCDERRYISEQYTPDVFKERNYFMVEHSVCGIAVFDEARNRRSGTLQTVNCARRLGKQITYIHPDTASVKQLCFPSVRGQDICHYGTRRERRGSDEKTQ